MAFDFLSPSKSSGISSFGTVNNTENNSANLSDIANSLDKINGLMDETKKRLTDHLLQEESKKSDDSANLEQIELSKLQSMVQAIQERLESTQTSNTTTVPTLHPDSVTKQDMSRLAVKVDSLFNEQNQRLQEAFTSLEKLISKDTFNSLLEKISKAVKYLANHIDKIKSDSVQVPQVQTVVETPQPQPVPIILPTEEKKSEDSISKKELLNIILGPELCSNPALEGYRNDLLDGFLHGNKEAAGFIGTMIKFQSTSLDRMPRLIQDIGEAYYRWLPKQMQGPGVFERTLANFVCSTCKSVGVNNTIELVEIGQRFDASRHNSTSRGVEIKDVKGWVVLRDDGKVFTRATVEVQ